MPHRNAGTPTVWAVIVLLVALWPVAVACAGSDVTAARRRLTGAPSLGNRKIGSLQRVTQELGPASLPQHQQVDPTGPR